MKKPGYTFEQHEKLGIELQAMYDRIGDIYVELGKAYTLKLADKVRPALNAVENLRRVLCNQVCQEHPEKDGLLGVYMRGIHDQQKPELPQSST